MIDFMMSLDSSICPLPENPAYYNIKEHSTKISPISLPIKQSLYQFFKKKLFFE